MPGADADLTWTTPAMADVFSQASRLTRMLDAEAALADALAAVGIIPAPAASAIRAACDVGRFDVEAIFASGGVAGTPVIPLVARLTELVDDSARGFVHWGATSQDIIDTGMALQMRDGLDLLCDDLLALGHCCAEFAATHRETLMAGRTLGQHALPTTFGLKAAQWLSAITAQLQRLRELRSGLAAQLGGASGTLAAYGTTGPQVAQRFADAVGLARAGLPWHSNRDAPTAVVAGVGLAVRAVGKISGDIVLLMQSEVGEVAEAPASGKGASSAMPHKRNPVDAVAAQAAARLALANVSLLMSAFDHEHERSAGAWQTEWAAVPQVFMYAAGAVARTRASLSGLQVDASRMRANLEQSGGLVLAESLVGALTGPLGRLRAQAVVGAVTATARERRIDLATAALAEPTITAVMAAEQIAAALDPAAYLGATDELITRALDAFAQEAQEA